MDDNQVLMVKKQVLNHLQDTLRRAKEYHHHLHWIQVAEGARVHNEKSELFKDLIFSCELLNSVLNPAPREFEVIEG